MVLATLIALPTVAGVGLLLAGRRADQLAGAVAMVTSTLTAGLAVAAAVARPTLSVPFLGLVDGGALGLAVDGLSAVLVVTVALVSLAVVAFATVDRSAGPARARFFGFLLLFAAAMLVTVTATTFPALLLAWEVMGATSFALIGFRWDERGKLPAATTAFVTTRAADVGLYAAAGAVLAGTGTFEIAAVGSIDGGWRDVAAAGILAAALGKAAQLPFSAWLSAAMQGPSPVSALLHSATMVAAGGYLLLRVHPLLEAVPWAATTAAWIGALTALVLGAVACAQSDLKQSLAASTAAQLGFVVLAAGVGSTAGGVDHIVAHAGVKAGLFVAVGAWLTALGTSAAVGQRGAGRRYPAMGAAAGLGCVVLAGVPPLSLWATKDEVLAGVEGSALHIVALAAVAIAAVYAGRILATVLGRPSPEQVPAVREHQDADEPGTRHVPAVATGSAAGLIVASAVLGVVAIPAVAHAVKELLHATGDPSPTPAALVLSGLLAVLVLVSTVRWSHLLERLDGTVLGRWAALPPLLTARPVMALARAAATVDDRGIDRAVWAVGAGARRVAAAVARGDDAGLDAAVRATASGTRRTAAMTASSDDGGIDAAVRAAAATVRRAGDWARRPQTGLLHQYYVMAAVGLGGLLLTLLVVR